MAESKSNNWWVWVLLLGGAAYLYFTSFANKLTFLIQNVQVALSGLLTQLNITLQVTSGSTTSVTLTNMQVTAYYNNAVIGAGIFSAPINPGINLVPVTISLSDLTILADIESAATNGVTGSVSVTLKGSGQVDGLPTSFVQTYNL